MSIIQPYAFDALPQINNCQDSKAVDLKVEQITKVTIPLWKHLLTLPISSFIIIGLIKIFNCQGLRHGTSIKNYISILRTGADPARGGSAIGSTQFFAGVSSENDVSSKGQLNQFYNENTKSFLENTKGHFYVFKDSETKQGKFTKCTGKRLDTQGNLVAFSEYVDNSGNTYKEQQYRSLSIMENIENYLAPSFHAAFSSISQIPINENRYTKVPKQIFYGLTNFLFSPTLLFIYSPEEVKEIFEDDPDYSGKAYRTTHYLTNDKIGFWGVCKHVSYEGFKEGISNRPLRTLCGIIQLVAGIAITLKGR